MVGLHRLIHGIVQEAQHRDNVGIGWQKRHNKTSTKLVGKTPGARKMQKSQDRLM